MLQKSLHEDIDFLVSFFIVTLIGLAGSGGRGFQTKRAISDAVPETFCLNKKKKLLNFNHKLMNTKYGYSFYLANRVLI